MMLGRSWGDDVGFISSIVAFCLVLFLDPGRGSWSFGGGLWGSPFEFLSDSMGLTLNVPGSLL